MNNKILLGVWGYKNQRVNAPRIPPLSRTDIGYFDINPFLLFDEVVIDERCYNDMMNSKQHLIFPYIEENAIKLLEYLKSTGRLTLLNYDNELNEFSKFVDHQIELDLGDTNITHKSLKESLIEWREFLDYCHEREFENKLIIDRIESMNEGIASSLKDIDSSTSLPSDLNDLLSSYLRDINSTLVLSHRLEVPFYDWSDYIPFYEYKMGRAGEVEIASESYKQKLNNLFQIFIPEFRIRDRSQLERLIVDSRIQDLRHFIFDSQQTKPEDIDTGYLASVEKNVLEIEFDISGYSKIVSYLTIPIGSIPIFGIPLQKMVEEIILHEIKNRKRKSYNWYYYLRYASKTYRRK